MKKKELDKPTFIYRNGMTADNDYVQWLHEVKLRYRQSCSTREHGHARILLGYGA